MRLLLAEAEVDALLVTTPANIRYLTGFSGSAGIVLVTADDALLVTDGRYRTQADEQLEAAATGPLVDVAVGGFQQQRDALSALVGRAKVRRIGLESDNVTWSAQRRWVDVLSPAEVIPTTSVVEQLRQVKDDGELWRMAKAAAIADAALEEVVPMLGQGRTEEEVALALDVAMRRLGAEDRAFETIVASGPNAAKPHARPTGRAVSPGESVVIDFGATFAGYRSDMTRTFSVGAPEASWAAVFDVVAAAQAAGVGAVADGVATGDVDKVCRDLITQAGWGSAFEHGTGHGVGLDIHEAPAVGRGSTAILTPGVVVTVEPGVYLPGIGGVRIEDTVVVTQEGRRVLTAFTKEIAA
jgi:Xaa-Pro aminopeptidase